MSYDNKITLQAFTELVARRARVSAAEADAFIHQFARSMAGELEGGGDVHLYRFGRFHTTHVDEQAGHNPNSGEALTIPEHSRVHFRPYSALRFAVNAPFRLLRIKELAPDKTGWNTRTGAWIALALLIVLLLAMAANLNRWVSDQYESLALPEITSTEMPANTGEQVIPVREAPALVTPLHASVVDTPVETEAAATAVVVEPGDSLWAIAESQWGDPYWWPVIYAENRPELSRRTPDLIDSGITLWIPVLTGSVESPSIADLRLRTSAYLVVAEDYRGSGNPRAAAYAKMAARWADESD